MTTYCHLLLKANSFLKNVLFCLQKLVEKKLFLFFLRFLFAHDFLNDVKTMENHETAEEEDQEVRERGSISPMVYTQLLRVQIPKAQKSCLT